MTVRAVSPVIGTVLIVGITVTLATVVGATVLALPGPTGVTPVVAISADVSSDGTIALTLDAGSSIDVRNVTVSVSVEGEPLAYQPPVPFFAAKGFYSETTGPFNSGADPTWSTGERTSVRVAGTNSPPIEEGSLVGIRVAVGDRVVADLEATAR